MKESVAIVKQPKSKFESVIKSFGLFETKPVVSVIRLNGVIGAGVGMKSGITMENFNSVIEKAFKHKKLVAVFLAINSPGGSPVQSELISSRIRQLASEKEVPVYSFIEDIGASGGYWLATSGDYIYASKNSIIGSIGVISSGFGFDKTIEKLGIQRRVYVSGKSKSVLDPFLQEKQEEIEIIKSIQNQIHQNFIDQVKTRRNNKLTQTDEILFNGEFWSGQTALDFGLIDGIDNMYSFIQKNFKDTDVKYSNMNQSWIKRKFGISAFESKDKVIEDVVEKATDGLIEKISNAIKYKTNI